MRQKSFSRNTSFLEQFKIMFQEVNLHLSWLDFCLTQPIYIPLTKFIPHLLFTFSMDCLLVTMLSTQFPITLLNGWLLGTLDLFFFDGSIPPYLIFFLALLFFLPLHLTFHLQIFLQLLQYLSTHQLYPHHFLLTFILDHPQSH